MLHVNEDNNDELFRKAAEDYLLKAESPDWEKLLNKINTGASASINIHETAIKQKKKHPLFMFFTWPHKKNGYNRLGFIVRFFRFGSWLEKSKKKIDLPRHACMPPFKMNLLFRPIRCVYINGLSKRHFLQHH